MARQMAMGADGKEPLKTICGKTAVHSTKLADFKPFVWAGTESEREGLCKKKEL